MRGCPERDISSLCVMGWGWEMFGNSSAAAVAAAAAVPLKVGVFWLTFSSPLGPRIEISARNRHKNTRTFGAHLFCSLKITKHHTNALFCQGAFFGETLFPWSWGPGPGPVGPGAHVFSHKARKFITKRIHFTYKRIKNNQHHSTSDFCCDFCEICAPTLAPDC